MAAHARLAPSAASRWMACSGSVALGEKAQSLLGPERQSSYAALGTALHEAAEHLLSDWDLPNEVVIGMEFHEVTVEENHLDRFIPYVDLVKSLGGEQFYEVRVILDEELVWGTADAIVIYCKKGIWRMAVIDLKTGSGVTVNAYKNYQLLVYAIGAFKIFDLLYPIKYIDMVISQPATRETPDVWTVDNLEIEEYHKEILIAMARVAEFPTAYTAGETQCRWCRGKALCPALAAEVERTNDMVLSEMTAANMADALELVPLVKAWVDGVEDFSKDFMLEGNAVPGYKVVGGRRSRGWEDVDLAQRYLKARVPKFQANCFTSKFKSPAQIETMLRKVEPRKEVDMGKLATWREGNPTIAKESDRRESIGPGSRAAADFAEVANE